MVCEVRDEEVSVHCTESRQRRTRLVLETENPRIVSIDLVLTKSHLHVLCMLCVVTAMSEVQLAVYCELCHI